MKMTRLNYNRRKSFLRTLLYIIVLTLSILFFATRFFEKIFPFEAKVFLPALRNHSAILHYLRERVDLSFHKRAKITQDEIQKILKFLEDRKKYNELLEARIQILEQEIPSFSYPQKDLSQSWILKKSLYRTAIIDGGLDREYEIGDIILNNVGEAIGKIVELSEHSSRIALFSKNGGLVQAIIEPAHLTINLTGDGVNLKTSLPRSAHMEEGNVVFLQCLPIVPLGFVSRVQFREQDSSKKIIVQTKKPFFETQAVFVLKGDYHCE